MKSKAVNIVFKILAWVLLAFTLVMVIFTVVSVTTVDKADRGILGFKFYVVLSPSMSPSENNAHLPASQKFNPNDIIISRKVRKLEKLESGDIISFISTNPDQSYGKVITHMIREPVYSEEDGHLIGFRTYGTTNGVDDLNLADPGCVVGKYVCKLPGLGYFFDFMKTTPGYIVCILVPFLLLILYNGVNVIRMFLRYRKEQTAELEAERAAIEAEREAEREAMAAERERNEAMLRELEALKRQLAEQQSPGDNN